MQHHEQLASIHARSTKQTSNNMQSSRGNEVSTHSSIADHCTNCRSVEISNIHVSNQETSLEAIPLTNSKAEPLRANHL